MNTDRNKAYQVTLGGRGTAGNWNYSLSFTHGEYKLTERNFVRWNDPINDYFEQRVLGPVLGTTSTGYDIYSPNWEAFYTSTTLARRRTTWRTWAMATTTSTAPATRQASGARTPLTT